MLHRHIRHFSYFKYFTPTNIDYDQLTSNADITVQIEEAFGQEGFGLLTVMNVPKFEAARERILPLARKLALLPEDHRTLLEVPMSKYHVGWSHGKEIVDGKPDLVKGSYYARPLLDDSMFQQDKKATNLWPSDTIPELEVAFKEMAKVIQECSLHFAKQLDKYISARIQKYPAKTLEKIVQSGENHVGRLIHYYPRVGANKIWCSWHNDYSAITGLVPPLYLRQSTGEVLDPRKMSDQNTGLTIKARDDNRVKAILDPKQLTLQIGEVVQILTGGLLKVTPHAVLNSGIHPNVSRQSFALYMAPSANFKLNCYGDANNVFEEHEGLSSLKDRWSVGKTFGEFHEATISSLFEQQEFVFNRLNIQFRYQNGTLIHTFAMRILTI